MSTIRINGLEKIASKVKDLQSMRAVKAGLKAAALHVKGKIAKYPPASEANKARGYNQYYGPGMRALNSWYQRGYGTKWRVKSGAVHGKKTSETLGRKWTTDERDGGLTQIVGNNVSYGPFVQSREDQAHFHKARGWLTVEDVAEQEAGKVVEFLQKHIDKALRK